MTKTAEQVARAYELLDFLETRPNQHDQSMWVSKSSETVDLADALADCGTTACAAGWTVLLAGMNIVNYSQVTWTYGYASSVPAAAAELLGLAGGEEIALFYDADDLADVREQIEVIFGPRPDGV